MADLSSLEIRINAIDKSSDALKDITTNLKNLGSALKGLNTSNVDKLANSLRSLNSLGKMQNNTKTINEMVDAFAKMNNVNTKGIDQLRGAFEALYKNMATNGGVPDEKYMKSIADITAQNITLRKTIDETDQAIRDYVTNYQKLGQVGIGNLKGEFGDDFKNFSATLGKQFKGSISGTLDQMISDMMAEIPGAAARLEPDVNSDSVHKLYDVLRATREETYTLEDALSSSAIRNSLSDIDVSGLEDVMWHGILDSATTIREQLEGISKSGEAVNIGFSRISEAISALSNITIPDTSGLESFATDLERLGSKSVANAANNLPKIAAGLSQIAASVSSIGSGNPLENLAHSVEQLGKVKSKNIPQIGALQTTGDISTASPQIQKLSENADRATGKIEELKRSLDGLGNSVRNLFGYEQGFISDIQNIANAKGYLDEAGNVIDGRMVPALVNVEETSVRIVNMFTQISKMANQMAGAFDSMQSKIGGMGQLSLPGSSDFIDAIEGVDFRDITSEISGGLGDVEDAFIRSSQRIAPSYENIGERAAEGLKKTAQHSTDLLANLMALGHEIGQLSSSFGKLGDMGIKGLKTLYVPMGHVINEYKEKLGGLVEAFKDFQKGAQERLKKLTDFWKRSMRTFTFMLVRKAITAVLKTMDDATKSLAKFSDMVGLKFNDSISNATADLAWMGRSILGAFEPLINVVVPILDQLAAAINRVMGLIGHFMAAITGQGYYVTAKKNVQDYAASLDKANKSQKNLTMGIDELNIISDSDSGSDSGTNPMDEWDVNEVSDKMKSLADEVKDIFSQIFNPMKEAWENAKDYVISGFKYMVDECGKLLSRIGQDFLKVWNQPETVAMLTNLLMMLGDIERVIGNFASRFREAWEEGEKGIHIFENIRDIFAILIEHARNVTEYMVGWSDAIDFNPLLEAVVVLTDSLKGVAEFFGQVFEDVMKNIVLKYINFLIEDGIPHLLNTISGIIEAFDFGLLRDRLVPVEQAFEGVLENIDIGITNAIGNIGKAVAEFVNSEDFGNFLETITWFMEKITADRVEKLFTALGTAVLDIAEAVMKFVSSDNFKSFIDKLIQWYDSKSAEEIAGYIEKIAMAIVGFKFTAFVGEGIAKFFEFLSVIEGASNISSTLSGISGSLTGVAGAAATGQTGILGFTTTLGVIGGVVAIAIGAVYSFVESFGGLEGAADRIKQAFDYLKESLSLFAEKLNLGEKIDALKEKFSEMLGKLGDMKDFWDVVINILTVLIDILGHAALIAFDGFLLGLDNIIGMIEGFIDILGGVGTAIMSLLNGDFTEFGEGVKRIWEGVKEVFVNYGELLLLPIRTLIDGVVALFEKLKYLLIGDPIVIDMWDGVVGAFGDGIKDALEFVSGLVGDVVGFFTDMKDKAVKKAKEFLKESSEKFKDIKDDAVEKFDEMKGKVVDKFGDIKNSVSEKAEAIAKGVKDNWDEMKKNINTTMSRIDSETGGSWTRLKNNITTIAGEAKKNVSKAFEDTKTAVGNFISGKSGIDETIQSIGTTLSGLDFSGFQSSWSTMWSDIGNVCGSWVGSIGRTISGLVSDGISQFQSMKYNLVGDPIVIDMWDDIQDAFATGSDESLSSVDGLSDDVVGEFDSMSTDLNTAGNGIFDNITRLFGGLTDKSDTQFNEMATRVVRAFGIMGDGAATETQNMGAQLNGQYRELLSKLQEFSDDVDLQYSDLSKMSVDQMSKMANSIKGVVSDMGDDIDGETKDMAINVVKGITAMAESAKSETAGMALGVQNKYADMKSDSSDLSSAIVDTFDGLASGAKTAINGLTDGASTAFGYMNKYISSGTSEMASDVTGQYNTMDDDVTEVNRNLQDDTSSKWQKISEDIKNLSEQAKNGLGDSFQNILTITGTVFDGVKDKVGNVMNGLLSTISNVIRDIITLFDFDLSFPEIRIPDIKMPHFNINWMDLDGWFSIPNISIDWYKRGGFPSSYSLFGAGEGGVAEMIGTVGGKTAVAGGEEITGIREAIIEQANQEAQFMSQMVGLLQEVAGKDFNVSLDSRSLVSGISSRSSRNGYDFRTA